MIIDRNEESVVADYVRGCKLFLWDYQILGEGSWLCVRKKEIVQFGLGCCCYKLEWFGRCFRILLIFRRSGVLEWFEVCCLECE